MHFACIERRSIRQLTHYAFAMLDMLCVMMRMRSHTQIVRAAGPVRLAALRRLSVHSVRSWATRNRIPPEHWTALVRAGHASLDELAEAAARCASCGETLCCCSDSAWLAATGGRSA